MFVRSTLWRLFIYSLLVVELTPVLVLGDGEHITCGHELARIADQTWTPLSRVTRFQREAFPRSILVSGVSRATRQCVGNCRHHGPLHVFSMMARSRGVLEGGLSPAYLTLQELREAALRALENPEVWRKPSPGDIPDDAQRSAEDLIDQYGVLPEKLGISEQELIEVAEKLYEVIAKCREMRFHGSSNPALLSQCRARIEGIIKHYKGDPEQRFKVGEEVFTPQTYAEALGVRYLPRKTIRVHRSNRPQVPDHPRNFEDLLMSTERNFNFQSASVAEAAELIESLLSRGIPLDFTLDVFDKGISAQIRAEQVHASRRFAGGSRTSLIPWLRAYQTQAVRGTHAVSIVGISYDAQKEPFLILQNSWGVTRHGPQGLLRLPLRSLLKDPDFEIAVVIPRIDAPPQEGLFSAQFFGENSLRVMGLESSEMPNRRKAWEEWFTSFNQLANQAVSQVVEVQQAQRNHFESQRLVLARSSAFKLMRYLYRQAERLRWDLYALENWIQSRPGLSLAEFQDPSDALEVALVNSEGEPIIAREAQAIRVESFDTQRIRILGEEELHPKETALVNPIDSLLLGQGAEASQRVQSMGLPAVRKQNLHLWALSHLKTDRISLERSVSLKEASPHLSFASFLRALRLMAEIPDLQMEEISQARIRHLMATHWNDLKADPSLAEILEVGSSRVANRMNELLRSWGLETKIQSMGLSVKFPSQEGSIALQEIGKTAEDRFTNIAHLLIQKREVSPEVRRYWLALARPHRLPEQRDLFLRAASEADVTAYFTQNRTHFSITETNLDFFIQILERLPEAQKSDLISDFVDRAGNISSFLGLQILDRLRQTSYRERFERKYLEEARFDHQSGQSAASFFAEAKVRALAELGSSTNSRKKMGHFNFVLNPRHKKFSDYEKEVLDSVGVGLTDAEIESLKKTPAYVNLMSLGIHHCPDFFNNLRAQQVFVNFLTPDSEGRHPWSRAGFEDHEDHLKEIESFIRRKAVSLSQISLMRELLENSVPQDLGGDQAWRRIFLLDVLTSLGLPKPAAWKPEVIQAALKNPNTFNTSLKALHLNPGNLSEYRELMRQVLRDSAVRGHNQQVLALALLSLDWREANLSSEAKGDLMADLMSHLDYSAFRIALQKASDELISSNAFIHSLIEITRGGGETFASEAYVGLGGLGQAHRESILRVLEAKEIASPPKTELDVNLRYALVALRSTQSDRLRAELEAMAKENLSYEGSLARRRLVNLGDRSPWLRELLRSRSEAGDAQAMEARLAWGDESAEFQALMIRELRKRTATSLMLLERLKWLKPPGQEVRVEVRRLLKPAQVDPRDLVAVESESVLLGRPSDQEFAHAAQSCLKTWAGAHKIVGGVKAAHP